MKPSEEIRRIVERWMQAISERDSESSLERVSDLPGDRFFGTTVHYAARVASQALGGEVLVSNLVRELVANSGVQFTESREVELKGLDGAHRLFAVDLTDR